MLAAFTAGSGATVSLAELARRTALPKPTLHRLLAALAVTGLVDKTPMGYRLGLRLFELGQQVPREAQLRDVALPFLHDLHDASQAMVHLAVLEGTDVVYIERLRGHAPVKVASRVGGRLPAYCTAVGKALLAHDPEATAATLAGALIARTPYTITDPRVLDRELDAIRRSGTSFDREENGLGIVCVAAPIMADGRAVAAVSVTCVPPRRDAEPYAPAVKATALGIGRSLSRAPTQLLG